MFSQLLLSEGLLLLLFLLLLSVLALVSLLLLLSITLALLLMDSSIVGLVELLDGDEDCSLANFLIPFLFVYDKHRLIFFYKF